MFCLKLCFLFCFVISLVCYFDLWWTRLENQEYHHCQNHWRLIHLSLNWTWEWDCYCCFHNWNWEFYWADRNNIGDSGLSSLSSGLKVNSSLTSLTLVFTFYFCIYSLSFFLSLLLCLWIACIMESVIQEYVHYHQHLWLIHLSLNCCWEFVYIMIIFIFNYELFY